MYLDAVGANGQDGLTRATDIFRSTPGYQSGLDMSLDALERRAASRGMLGSGNTIADTTKLATDYSDQKYKDFVGMLAPTIAPEVQGATGQAGINQNIANLYTTDANNRVNVATGTTKGITDQNTQEANAIMQGSGNLWNFGLNAAKLGSGFWGYGNGYGGAV